MIAYDCATGICVVKPDGTGGQQLTNASFPNGGTPSRPRWSPDGSRITFDANGDLYAADANGGTRIQITTTGTASAQGTALDPSFSDAQTLLFASSARAAGIYSVVAAAGGAPQAVLTGSGAPTRPAPRPVGPGFAYIDTAAGNALFYFDGDVTHKLTDGYDDNPVWAPDGSRIYFQHLPPGGGQWEIDSIRPDMTGRKTILTGDTIEPAPSPDGTKLAYYQTGSGAGIHIADVNGCGATQVPNTGAGNFDPAWQPTATPDPAAITACATQGPLNVGATATDVATLAGLPPGAGGTITFSAYTANTCTGTPVYTSGPIPVTGNDVYSATGFQPQQGGIFYWTAAYSGDTATNAPALATSCGAPNQSTSVTAPPTLPWTGSGPGTTTVVSDGTTAPPQFHYDYDSGCHCGASGTWTFQTTAVTAGDVTLPYTFTGLHAWFQVRVGLTAFVQRGGQIVESKPLVNDGPQNCCTPPSNGFKYTGSVTLTGIQIGDTFGFTITGSNFDFNSFLRGTLTLAPDVTNDAWPFATKIDLDANGDGSVSSDSLNQLGQARWYKFTVAPGENLNVDLTNLPGNYDLVLFSDIGQAFKSLNSVSDLQQLSAQFAPGAFSPGAFSPGAFSPGAFSPGAFSPGAFSPGAFSPGAFSPGAFSPGAFSPGAFSPGAFSPGAFSDANGSYEAAQTVSVVAISAADGTADEHIVANTWNNGGSFYIRVAGRNGAYAPDAPVTVHVHEDQSSCSGVAPDSSSQLDLLSPASIPTGVKTLIFADYARMPSTGLAGMQSKLALYAQRPEVGGSIVDLGTQSPRVAALLSQADANTACPYAENLAGDAIRAIVQAYRDANPGLQDIVLVGNDHAIPFFRYPDAAGLGSESNYVPPVTDNTASQASLRLNYVLSEDAYGARTILHQNGLDIPVPDLPVGRLVETPSDVAGILDAYLGTTGGVVPTPTSSLVTGYDFLAGSAQSVETDFAAGLGSGATNDQLITNSGVAPTDTGVPPNHSWTAAQLKAALLGSRHDLIYLAGHFTADNTLAADFSTTMDATDLAASNVDLKNAIVFSAGCHSGYNIVDTDAISGVTQPLDWVQVLAEKQATTIAGTGYQYGDTDFTAYSARLYASFARDLRTLGSGPVGVGNALVAAKQQYLETTPQLSGMDVKALLEATLYGLPQLAVNMPGNRGALTAAPNVAAASSITTQPFTTNPGLTLGLSYSDQHYTPSLTPKQVQLGTVTARYFEGPDGVFTAPGEPALPVASQDATVGGQVLRGVGFRGGSFSDTTGVTPLVGAPTTDLSTTHGPFVSSTFFPQKPWTVNYFDGLANGSTATRLMLTPVQYESDSPGSLTDLQRVYSSLDLRLFYSANTQTYGPSTPALAAPPTIARVDASQSGGTVTFSAHVVGDPAAGIQQVWVTYTGAPAGQWQSLDLQQDATDSTLWTGTLQTSSPMQFMVQAANGVGLVTLDDNAGRFYVPNQIAPALTTSSQQATSLAFAGGTPSTGAYGSQLSAQATLTSGGSPVPGKQVTFTLGGVTQTGTTDQSGNVTGKLPLVNLPGAYALTAAFGGDTALRSSSASSGLSITKLGTSLAAGPPGVTKPGADTGISATLTSGGTGLGQRTVAFVLTPGTGSPITQTRVTDPSGKALLGVVPQLPAGSYSVQAFFGAGAPIPLAVDPVYNGSQSGTTQLIVDGTSPTITFVGNKAAYDVTNTVHITCTAADPAPASGVKTNPCTGFAIDGPAWTFKPGQNTLPNPGLVATDNVGNSSAPATTSFTVNATVNGLSSLIKQFFGGDTNGANGLIAKLNAITSAKTASAKAGALGAFNNQVDAKTGKPLTAAQAAALKAFAATL